MVCEDCPNLLLKGFIDKRNTVKKELDKEKQELETCRIKDKYSGRNYDLGDQIRETRSLCQSYRELVPDRLVCATEHCTGPFERVDETEGDREYVTQICGAEVLAKEVTGYTHIEDVAIDNSLDDNTTA